MINIELRYNKNLPTDEVLNLYNDAEWKAYTSSPEILMTAIENSLFVLTAWNGNSLVGLLRAVGDGLTIIYIQDILILRSYRRKGIGRLLLTTTLEKFDNVRQIVLLTDKQNEAINFYENVGLQQTKNLNLLSFIRLKMGTYNI
ncbi:MAG: N-acetyltransferase [Bacteroidia bacterium]|nr:MAG: N-acetyltransferase [Bacteroidia bacterium]GIV29822.1 MAG: N-acetyltransferase [Bacteroidia bacterium]GIV29831.1 MAG: N-acetyltransferase [Bacteroidia bacterium]GIV29834.1 MAG: N-acetyltransferase [Bacteroidia bacterium]GIV30274.1 MAG: N-acetyltransferase [Bacteroidia bacterium]